jgi:hypothetical protein
MIMNSGKVTWISIKEEEEEEGGIGDDGDGKERRKVVVTDWCLQIKGPCNELLGSFGFMRHTPHPASSKPSSPFRHRLDERQDLKEDLTLLIERGHIYVSYARV